MRKTYIAGNWKMNMGLESAKELLNEIKNEGQINRITS